MPIKFDQIISEICIRYPLLPQCGSSRPLYVLYLVKT